MATYITLPGTSGHYLSTPDVNLLDADTAHMYQSVGNWTAGAGASAVVQDTTPPYTVSGGFYAAKATTDGTGAVLHTLTTPSLSGAEHTVSLDIYCDTAGREAFVTLDGTNGTVTALTSGSVTRLSATKTVTAGTKTVTVTYRQTDDSDPAGSEEVWISRACINTGTSTTFVPSLQIEGDLDMRAKFSPDSITAFQRIINFLSGNNGYSMLVDSTSGKMYFEYGDGASNRAFGDAPTALVVDTATVVQATFDVSTGGWEVFQDGVSVGTATRTIAAGAPPSGQTFYVGQNAAGAQIFDGDIYYVEVRDGIDGPVVARMDAEDWVGI